MDNFNASYYIFSASNSSTKDQGQKNDDDDVSLSGLSSNEGDRLQIRSDVEDGEIIPKVATVEEATVNNHGKKSDSSDLSDQENKSRRRFRKRSEASESEKERSERSPIQDQRSDRRSSTPR